MKESKLIFAFSSRESSSFIMTTRSDALQILLETVTKSKKTRQTMMPPGMKKRLPAWTLGSTHKVSLLFLMTGTPSLSFTRSQMVLSVASTSTTANGRKSNSQLLLHLMELHWLLAIPTMLCFYSILALMGLFVIWRTEKANGMVRTKSLLGPRLKEVLTIIRCILLGRQDNRSKSTASWLSLQTDYCRGQAAI